MFLKQFQRTQVDIFRADFARVGFARVNFARVDFARVNFARADFARADFAWVGFAWVDFARVDFAGLAWIADIHWVGEVDPKGDFEQVLEDWNLLILVLSWEQQDGEEGDQNMRRHSLQVIESV